MGLRSTVGAAQSRSLYADEGTQYVVITRQGFFAVNRSELDRLPEPCTVLTSFENGEELSVSTSPFALNERSIEMLELVASVPKARGGVYVLDEQDMQQVRSALRAVGVTA